MEKIVEGIRQFQSGDYQENEAFFRELAKGQSPQVLFITCADSRIDPNRLTQTKPGEVFVLRTAGNIVPPYGAVKGGEAATIEYAVCALKIPHIVVCGHSHCGAMSGLLAPENLGALPAVRAYLEHAEATARIVNENYADVTDFDQRLSLAVEENVLVQLENLRTHPTVAAAIGRGETRLHGWVYKFESAEVLAFNPDKKEFVHLEDDSPAISELMRPARANS